MNIFDFNWFSLSIYILLVLSLFANIFFCRKFYKYIKYITDAKSNNTVYVLVSIYENGDVIVNGVFKDNTTAKNAQTYVRAHANELTIEEGLPTIVNQYIYKCKLK